MRKRKCRILSNAGDTMVEVLVAFLLVMIMVVSFSKTVTVCVNLFGKSRQIIEATERFNAAYYSTYGQASRQSTNSGVLNLYLDKVKTAPENTLSDVSIALPEADLMVYRDAETGLSRYTVVIKTISDPFGSGG